LRADIDQAVGTQARGEVSPTARVRPARRYHALHRGLRRQRAFGRMQRRVGQQRERIEFLADQPAVWLQRAGHVRHGPSVQNFN
jgi:hypothetical protein